MHRFKSPVIFLVLTLTSCSSGYSSFSDVEQELDQVVQLLKGESKLFTITNLKDSGIREVNDEDVVEDSTQINSLQATYGALVTQAEFLSRNGIDRKIYAHVTALIDSSDIFKVEQTSTYVAFHMGGFMDSYAGYLFLKQGQELEEEKDYVFGAPLMKLQRIPEQGNWYEFISD